MDLIGFDWIGLDWIGLDWICVKGTVNMILSDPPFNYGNA